MDQSRKRSHAQGGGGLRSPQKRVEVKEEHEGQRGRQPQEERLRQEVADGTAPQQEEVMWRLLV